VSVLTETKFTGTLKGKGATVPASFHASIDSRGALCLRLDPIPFSKEAFTFWNDGDGRYSEHFSLTGVSAGGDTFTSDSFSLTSRTHRVEQMESQLDFQGHCAEAVLEQRTPEPIKPPQMRWYFRQFETFHTHRHETAFGRVEVAGARHPSDDQALTGYLAISARDDTHATWWNTAEATLAHVARVLSLASGTYLRSYVTVRLDGTVTRLQVNRRSDAAAPFLPPFIHLNLGPIFRQACESFATQQDRLLALDPALRWFLAPAQYDEARLLQTMTALESIVDSSDKAEPLMPEGFDTVATTVRAALRALNVPAAMLDKIPELNRRSFRARLQAYLCERAIVMADFPADSVRRLIKARNGIVHRGVYYDDSRGTQTNIWEHIVHARELVIRVILAAIGFRGNYFSMLHNHRQIAFPECRPV